MLRYTVGIIRFNTSAMSASSRTKTMSTAKPRLRFLMKGCLTFCSRLWTALQGMFNIYAMIKPYMKGVMIPQKRLSPSAKNPHEPTRCQVTITATANMKYGIMAAIIRDLKNLPMPRSP
jgi:hypothetical protein